MPRRFADPQDLAACRALLRTGSRGHADSANEPFAATNLILLDAMQHLGRRLAPIAECGN